MELTCLEKLIHWVFQLFGNNVAGRMYPDLDVETPYVIVKYAHH